jgi:predicted DNA-binding ribbon-helix-helix protein
MNTQGKQIKRFSVALEREIFEAFKRIAEGRNLSVDRAARLILADYVERNHNSANKGA